MHDEVGDFPRQATYAHEHVKCKSNKPAKKSVNFHLTSYNVRSDVV